MAWIRTGLLLAAPLLLGLPAAQAQSVWQGTTSDYGTAGNWNNNTPPIIAGQSAVFSSTGTTNIAVASPIAPDSWTFNNSSQGYSISGSAVIFGTATGLVDNASGQSITIANNLAGTGAVSANDTNGGILILSGTNSYSGATSVTANAYLLANAATALSANSAFTVDGLLDLGGNSNSIKSLSGSAAGLVTSSTADAVLTISGTASTSFDGTLVDGGAGSSLGLTLAGTSTLTLTGNDTGYFGATTIGSGATLRAGSVTAFSYNSNFTVNGTLDLGGFNNVIGSLAGSGTVINSGGTDAVLTTGFKNVASIFGGNITDGGTNLTGLTVDGTGALTLSGNNSYGGDTVVCNCGILKAGSVTALSPNSFYTVDGKLDLNGFSNSIAALAGTGIITNDGAAAATLTIANASGTDFGGNIQDGAKALALALTNSQQTLSGNNSYTGTTSVDVNSTLQAGSAAAFSAASAFSLDGLLDLNGFNNSIASLSDSGAGTGLVSNSGGSDAILTITGSANSSYSGQIADSGAAIGLTLSGTGTLTLTQSFGALYSGATTIAAGATLKAGDSTTFSSLSDHTVNGTLDLNGFDNYIGALAGSGTVTNSGASLAVLDIFTANGDTIFSGSITDGTGHVGLSVSGPDKLILTGNNNSFSEGILICACAVVQVGNGGTTGSIGTGEIGDEGTLIINRSNIFLLSNDVSDAGSGGGDLVQAGTGTTILTGTNSYAGSTTINAGTLQVGNGGTAGTLGGSGTITDNGILAFNRSDTVTLDRVIAGSGGLTKLGAGTLILTRDNSYSGTTTISAGTLQIGSGGTVGSLGTGNLVNNGVLVFNRSDAVTVANAMSGSGSLTKLGSAVLTLTGDNSYSGTTTISAGTLALNGSGAIAGSSLANNAAFDISATTSGATVVALTGSGTVALGSKTLTISNAGGTFSGVISGSGGVTVTGGAQIFTGANSYDGVTTISAGTLQVGNDGTTGSLGTGAITDNGTLVYKRSDTVTLAAAISGTGKVSQLGTGTLVLTGANSYSGATTISAGTLALSGAGTVAGSSSVADAGTFDISAISGEAATIQALTGSGVVALGTKSLIFGAGSGVFSGTFTGTGSLQLNGGTTTFTGTIANNMILATGATLQLGNGGTSGTFTGTLTNNGTLSFNRSDTVTLPSTITGSGNLAQAGNGTLIVANANNFGGITISAGTLQVSNGGSLGSGAIVNNGILAFDRSDAITLSNAISGSGGLTKSGNGNLILTGTSSYTGATTIAGGTLSVNGSIASSPVSVGSGGTLGGNGATGPVTVASGGKIAAGNSIGTLTVASLTLAPGSTTTAELSPTANDRINVTGAASLDGALILLPEAGTYSATSYRLIQAGSLTGTFSSVTGSVPGFINTVQYSATAVDFILSTPAPTPTPTPTPIPTPTPTPTPVVMTYLFGTYGNTPNQIAAGNSLAAASSSSALYTALGALVGSNLAAVGPTFGLLAGDIRPSLRAAAIEDSRILRNIILDRMDRPDGTGLWGAGFGGYGSLAGDGNAAALHHDSAGFLAGLDFPVTPDIRLGIAGGYTTNHARTGARLSTADGNAGHIGAYAAWHAGAVSMTLGGDYGFGKADIARAISQLGQVNTSTDDLKTSQVFADLGYRLALEGLALQPHATLAHISATSGAFAETGSISALSGAQAKDSLTYAILGLRSQLSPAKLEDYELVPRLDLGWQHALSPLTPGQMMTYQTGNTSFLALGTPLARDAAAIQAGFDLDIGPAVLSIAYDGSFARATENHALRGSFNWKF